MTGRGSDACFKQLFLYLFLGFAIYLDETSEVKEYDKKVLMVVSVVSFIVGVVSLVMYVAFRRFINSFVLFQAMAIIVVLSVIASLKKVFDKYGWK